MKAKPPVQVAASAGSAKSLRRTFPGPRGAEAALRVAIDRSAHAELMAHAKESLHAEVCGVLAGSLCEDDEGSFVHVEAVVRGSQASGGSTHVTFTQETWTAIHQVMDREHAQLQIVGWYHTHPGFGVEFSEMDLFIQRNFFSGKEQIALVTDPLTGAVAIAANSGGGGITYLPRYWVDGREHPAKSPNAAKAVGTSGATGADVGALESRVNQLTHAVEDLHQALYRFLLYVGVVVALLIVGFVAWVVREQFSARISPPSVNQVVPIPVRVGEKTVMLGVGVTQWDVPPELNAILLDLAREEAEAKAAEAAPTEPPAPAPTATPAPPSPDPKPSEPPSKP